MLTTGLVSLNVHEALTFDGTEIVLHPDLFASDGLSTVNSIGTTTSRHPSNIRPAASTGGSAAIAGVGSIGQVATEASKDAPQLATAIASSQQPPPQQQGTPLLTTTPSAEAGKLTWGTGGASIMSQRRLEVGDMIEIRVWDPTPMRDRHQSPGGVSSVFRKRGGASVQSNQSSAESVSTEAQKSNTTASKKGSNNSTPSTLPSNQTPAIPPRNALDSVTSNLSRKMSTTTYSSSANSMQYSEFSGSDQVHPISSKSLALTASVEAENVSTIEETVRDDGTSNSNNDETSAVGSSHTEVETNNNEETTKSLLTSPSNSGKNIFTMPATLGGKPPVSSRGRSNTSDIPRLSITNVLPKPPLQPRASTHGDRASTHGDMNFAAYEARKRSSKPIHTREISDMTTDSMVHGLLQNFPPHHPQQNTHSQQQHISSSGSNHADFDVLGVDFLDQRDGHHGQGGEDDTEADDVLSIIGKSHHMRFSFVMLVTENTLTSLKGSARTQISMLRQVADLYKLSSYDMVSINRIEKNDESAVLEAVSADFVLFSMKDQFISRGDMHAFQKALIGTWVYEGQRLTEVARVSTLYLQLRCFIRAYDCTFAHAVI